MIKSYFKVAFITYIIMFVTALFLNFSIKVEAQEEVSVNEKIYYLEMSKADFSEIKADILSKDLKYVAYPNELSHDIKLSEVNASDINHKSFDVQTIEISVSRYTESNDTKKKIDSVSETVKIKFVDTTAPTITLSKEKVEIEEDESFNANKYIKEIYDNSFDEIKLDIDSDVDSSTPGEYEVVYTAVDSSNNESSEVLKVVVNKKVVVVAPKIVTPTVSAPQVSVSAPANSNSVMATLNVINQYRANAGLAPLSLASSTHQLAAQTRAIEAASYVSHYRPDGRHYKTAFSDLGLNSSNVYEILTYSGTSPADKVAWWMSSGSHQAILMRSDLTHIAIGISGGMYVGMVYR